MKPDVSVIVPVYNVELYLSECIQSLINQTFTNIEIVCVNDGSTDHSLDILRQFQKQDDRITIINKENTGYGNTVNQGIEAAKGKYIGIIESDDFVADKMFETLYQTAVINDADVVRSNYNLYFTETNRVEFQETLWAVPYGKVLSVDEKERLFFSAPAVWTGLYKKDFLKMNHIAFTETEGASYQDIAFAFKVVLCAKRAIALEEAFIFYRQDNVDSSINSSSKTFCVCDEMEEILSYLAVTNNESKMPVYVKNKYSRYKWNLDRLSGQGKRQFLIKMHSELKKDCFNGYLIKRYWSDSEWDEVHRLIFDFESFYEETFSDAVARSPEEENKRELIFKLRQAAPLLIYGAGKRSRRLIQLLRSYDIYPDGVVVTSMSDNPESLEGIPVMDIEYVSKSKRDALILLGVTAKYRDEIMTVLKERYMSGNCFVIDDKMWALLEKGER